MSSNKHTSPINSIANINPILGSNDLQSTSPLVPWSIEYGRRDSYPKNPPTRVALVLSSSGTESLASVSGMSEVAFLATKNAWKNTNLQKERFSVTQMGRTAPLGSALIPTQF